MATIQTYSKDHLDTALDDKADLVGGVVPNSQLPPLAITDTSVVASQAAMLALTAEVGDVAIRSDLNKSFILQATPASTLGNWKELLTPTDVVLSVDGQTGAITLPTDAAAGTGSKRTLGTSATSAAAGNDSRLSDARTPTAHAASHASAGGDAVTLAESQVTGLTTDLAAKVALAGSTSTGEQIGPSFKASGKTGATATPITLAGGTASGAPSSGAHIKGEVVLDDAGQVWYCTVAGTPGTWVSRTAVISSFAATFLDDADAATGLNTLGAAPTSAVKASVRVATYSNGTLASAYENGDTVDGVTLATGDRILLAAQTTGAENGIYTVNASGAPTRAVDFDASAEVVGGINIEVREGTAFAGRSFRLTNTGAITLGTTALTFAIVPTGQELGYAERTTSHTSTSTTTGDTISSLSVTVVGTGRPVEVRFSSLGVFNSTANKYMLVYLLENGVGRNVRETLSASTGVGPTFETSMRRVLTAGTSYTYGVLTVVEAGTGTVGASATSPMYLSVREG